MPAAVALQMPQNQEMLTANQPNNTYKSTDWTLKMKMLHADAKSESRRKYKLLCMQLTHSAEFSEFSGQFY